MAKDPTLKKKRKSEAMLEPAAPAEGSTSAQAVVAEVDSEKKSKKAKKDKKDKKQKDADGDVTMATEAGDVTVDGDKKQKKEKVNLRPCAPVFVTTKLIDVPSSPFSPHTKYQQTPSPPSPALWPPRNCKRSS